MQLSARIRAARLRTGLSQADFADQLGVGRTAVAHWESCAGRTRPSSARLEQIAILTNVSWEWLATGRGHAVPSGDDIPAVDADFIEDPIERTLLKGFRAGNERMRQVLLTIAEEQLPAARANR